jgi:hypothetical protein
MPIDARLSIDVICTSLASTWRYTFPIFYLLAVRHAESAENGKIVVGAGDVTYWQQVDSSNPDRTIEKTGDGDAITGTANYLGPARVSAGRWFANGQMGATGSTKPITVASAATLGGQGPVNGHIINYGTVTPSAGGITTQASIPIGTIMTVVGSYLQQTGGVTKLYIRPDASDRIAITGDADFTNGNITISPISGDYTNPSGYTTTITWTGTGPVVLPRIINQNPSLKMTAYLGANSLSITLTGVGVILSTTSGAPTDVSSILNSAKFISAADGAHLSSSATSTNTVSIPIAIESNGNSPSTFNIAPATGSTIELAAPISGDNNAVINLSGAGITNLTADSTRFTGTLNPTAGKLKVNADFSSATVQLASGATIGGTGTIKDLIANGGIVWPGNSIGTLNVSGNFTPSGNNTQVVEIRGNKDPLGNAQVPMSGLVKVLGNTGITGNYTFDLLLNAGTYTAGSIIDYTILQTGGILTTTGARFYLKQAANPGLTVSVGVLSAPEQPDDGKKIIVKLTVGGSDVVVNTDQTATDGGRTTTEITVTPITINPGDIVAENISAEDVTSAAVMEQVEITKFIFIGNQPFNDPAQAAVEPTFRFKFGPATAATTSSAKGAMEALLTAISKNGPVSYERNETRFWITPYANRARARKTNSSSGNQGWSGGSLIGIEQRDKKNVWSIGIVTGLMASKSYVIGRPNNFSKTNGMLFGAFNTLKYTDNKKGGNFGHELLISRTVTSVNAQRDGVDAKDKVTPFYALSAYKTTTDIANGQLNYLFDVIKKSVTCRLNTGMTYINTNYGAYREKGAGTNGINRSSSSNQSLEWYNGIGIRKIWNHEKITIRTTFVYEYGYNVKNSGSVETTTTQSTSPTTFTTPPGPRQNKHYIQLNSSYLDRGSGLKFVTSYSGVLYKNVTNHTGMFKVEYRF